MVTTRAVLLDGLNVPEDPSTVRTYRAPLWCPSCDVGATYERCWICGGEMVKTEARLMSVSRNGTCAMTLWPGKGADYDDGVPLP